MSFRDRGILEQSLVHRSFLNENVGFPLGSNERLEYLGDAVVALIVSDYLYQHYPMAPEGTLTALRAALVRAQSLARFARSLELGDLLFLSHGEEETGARTRTRLLGQAFEAVVGAVYLDQGLPAARDLVQRLLVPEIERLGGERMVSDPKSRLQEVVQAREGATPVYRVVSATGPGHRRHFVVEARIGERVLGVGEGHKKQEAEENAARLALEIWPPPARG